MSEAVLCVHKLNNLLQTFLLLGGMGLLLATIGWTVLGPAGIWWVLLIGLAVLAMTPRLSPRVLLHLYRARQIDPDEAPDLYRLVTALARRAGLSRVPRLYYVPSRVLNAFTMGARDAAAVGLTDGLLRHLSLRELAGVLAHEVSHIRNDDVWVMGLADLVSRLTAALSFAGQLLLLVSIPLALLTDAHISWLAIVLLIVAPTLSALLQLGLSRIREFDADLSAAELSGDPQGLAAALKKLDRLQGGWFERVFLPGRRNPEPSLLRTHPPTEERVRRLLSLAPQRPRQPITLDTRAPSDLGARPIRVIARGPRWRWHGLWY